MKTRTVEELINSLEWVECTLIQFKLDETLYKIFREGKMYISYSTWDNTLYLLKIIDGEVISLTSYNDISELVVRYV